MARKCTEALFDDVALDLYRLVKIHRYTLETAAKAEANYLENHGIYGFKEMALKHGCRSLRDLYVYGGRLAGDAATAHERKLAPAT